MSAAFSGFHRQLPLLQWFFLCLHGHIDHGLGPDVHLNGRHINGRKHKLSGGSGNREGKGTVALVVIYPVEVPFTNTEALAIGAPFSSVTFPVIVFLCP